ncbi:MAG TPA: hypothetical protein VJ124_14950 [Pyrinomonadaceae bacterium]|nr:hypothetical protein [Pyrinomonadaceae bacterium]
MTSHFRPIALIALLASVLVTPAIALGQSDTTPPTLVSFSFTPSAIDTTAAQQPVTVTMRVTDDLAGAFPALLSFVSPSGRQGQAILTGEFNLIFGTSLDGVWQATLNFPQFTESGAWTVSGLLLNDLAGNSVALNAATLQALGFPVTLSVTSTPDTTPPQLVGLRLTPSAVDVSAGVQDVTVELDLIDALAGVQLEPERRGFFLLTVRSPSGGQSHSLSNRDFQLISGTAQNGTWQGTLRIPQFSEAGTWTVGDITVPDAASNTLFVSTSQLRALGFSPDLGVTSVPSDTTPPQLVGFTFTPILIDTSISAVQVTVTYTTTDNLAGVDFSPDNPTLTGFQAATFRSPSGAQVVVAEFFNLATLIAGTPQNGVWRSTFIFARFSEAGTWTVRDVMLRDAVRNRIFLNTAALRAAGFPTELIVVQPSLLVDGTVAPTTGGTVMDQVFGARAQVTFPPGVLSATTQVAIDVFESPLSLPTPSGFTGPGTRFVNINLTPQPAFPLPPPGLTVVLPLTNVMIPGDRIDLFRVDPATGNLVPALDVAGQPVVGTVDAGGLSATFTGVAGLSIVVGLVPATIPTIPVMIDIKPGSFPNSINPKSTSTIPVAILSTADFDAPSEVDKTSLTFGRTGNEQSLAFCNKSAEDVNSDGLLDQVCHFRTRLTGLQKGDTEGILNGMTVDGVPIEGRDSVRIVK